MGDELRHGSREPEPQAAPVEAEQRAVGGGLEDVRPVVAAHQCRGERSSSPSRSIRMPPATPNQLPHRAPKLTAVPVPGVMSRLDRSAPVAMPARLPTMAAAKVSSESSSLS